VSIVLRKLVNDSEFILVATRFGKKSIVLWCFQWMLVFNFTTPHTDFDIKHDLKWMKGNEMKNMSTSLSILQLHSILWPSWTGVCVFFLLSNCDFTKLMNSCFWKHNLEWKRSFFSKKTSVTCAIEPKCYHVLNWFFLPKPREFIWIFSGRIHSKINISHILNPNLIR